MNLGDVSLACAWALVDELARGGVRHACLSPGSRSTPLALALSRHPSIELQVHLDERSSAFVALGLARATRRPVIVACTSGTAAAGFLPAVIEASRSRVPLVLLTADRPPRLRGTGANQTIDQVDLYGSHAEYLEPPVPLAPDDADAWRAAGHDAVLGIRRTLQPVQVNCPFDEPLTPSPDVALKPTTEPSAWPEQEEPSLSEEDADRLASELSGTRSVVVAGPTWPHDGTSVNLEIFELLGWPVLAEPISGMRRPGALAAGQSLIADETWVAEHRPEVVLQVGATPTTRATQGFVASAERLIVADRIHPDPDPEHRATWRLRADLPEVMAAIGGRDVMQLKSGTSGIAVTSSSIRPISDAEIERRLARALEPAPAGWNEAWRDADTAARTALDAALDGWEEPFEPRIARDVAASIPDGGTLLVGNSSPIRDLDLAMRPRERLHVVANRGASGIDGLVSTTIGVASARRGPTVALLGDLSFAYDIGALTWNARRTDLDLTLVVANNGGGQVFSLLPQRVLPEHRDLFVTPHELDLEAICAAVGAPYHRVEAAGDLVPTIRGSRNQRGIRVVNVTVDADRDEARREEQRKVVRVALDGAA